MNEVYARRRRNYFTPLVVVTILLVIAIGALLGAAGRVNSLRTELRAVRGEVIVSESLQTPAPIPDDELIHYYTRPTDIP